MKKWMTYVGTALGIGLVSMAFAATSSGQALAGDTDFNASATFCVTGHYVSASQQ